MTNGDQAAKLRTCFEAWGQGQFQVRLSIQYSTAYNILSISYTLPFKRVSKWSRESQCPMLTPETPLALAFGMGGSGMRGAMRQKKWLTIHSESFQFAAIERLKSTWSQYIDFEDKVVPVMRSHAIIYVHSKLHCACRQCQVFVRTSQWIQVSLQFQCIPQTSQSGDKSGRITVETPGSHTSPRVLRNSFTLFPTMQPPFLPPAYRGGDFTSRRKRFWPSAWRMIRQFVFFWLFGFIRFVQSLIFWSFGTTHEKPSWTSQPQTFRILTPLWTMGLWPFQFKCARLLPD